MTVDGMARVVHPIALRRRVVGRVVALGGRPPLRAPIASTRRTRLVAVVVAVLVVGCGSSATVPSASPPLETPLATPSLGPIEDFDGQSSTPRPSATPTATAPDPCLPDACASEPPMPSVARASGAALPVLASALDWYVSVMGVPGPDGGLYLAVAQEERVLLGLYDARGALRAGWPVVIASADGCSVASATDGSVRAVCRDRAFAFDAAGRSLAGWPVTVGYGYHVEVVGNELRLETDAGVVRVSADARVRVPSPAPAAPSPSPPTGHQDCLDYRTTARDGTGFLLTRCLERPVESIDAFDATGHRPGWPVSVLGAVSDPITGPDGRVYVVQGDWAASVSRVLAFERDGQPVAGWSEELEGLAPHVGTWAEPYIPMAPIVATDGGVRFITQSAAYALDPSGAIREGWPHRHEAPLGTFGYCGPCEIDCFPAPSTPALGPDDTLYLIQAPSGSTGGRITAIGPDGKVRDGWPVVLRKPGAEFWWVAPSPDGTLFALAIELEGPAQPPKGSCAPPASATVLAIAPDGQVRWRLTVVEP